MLFIGCETALGGIPLPDAAVDAGADYAIGTKFKISCDDANRWVNEFFEYYSLGYTIIDSCGYATEAICGIFDFSSMFYIAN